jgi:hypothetical protein
MPNGAFDGATRPSVAFLRVMQATYQRVALYQPILTRIGVIEPFEGRLNEFQDRYGDKFGGELC